MVAPPCEGSSCQLFGFFGIAVQFGIGAWCLFTLVVLWRLETQPRSFLTWLGDMSKQLVGAGWGHFMNIFVALLFGEALDTPTTNNQCVWYLVGFMSDIVLVTFLCWAITVSIRPHVRTHFGFDIGEYEGGAGGAGGASSGAVAADSGSAPEGAQPVEELRAPSSPATWSPIMTWCCQTAIWLFIMTVVKATVSLIVYLAKDVLYTGIALAFHGLSLCGHENRQLIASVIVVPVIGDAFQFAVQDTFLKKKSEPAPPPVETYGLVLESFAIEDALVAKGTGGKAA